LRVQDTGIDTVKITNIKTVNTVQKGERAKRKNTNTCFISGLPMWVKQHGISMALIPE